MKMSCFLSRKLSNIQFFGILRERTLAVKKHNVNCSMRLRPLVASLCQEERMCMVRNAFERKIVIPILFPGGTAQKLWDDLKKDYVDNKKKVQKAKSGAGVCDLDDFIFEKNLKFLDLALEKRSVKK